MKKFNITSGLKIITSILLLTPLFSARAVDYTWGGGDLLYSDTSASGWSGGPPNLITTDSATINSGSIEFVTTTNYLSGFRVGNGNSFTMDGGTFTQSGVGYAHMYLGTPDPGGGTGTLTINAGATFNMGSSDFMRVGISGKHGYFYVNGGTFESNGAGTRIGDGSTTVSTFQLTGAANADLTAFRINSGNVQANGGTLDYTTMEFNKGSFSIDGSTVTQSSGNLSVATGNVFSLASGSLSMGSGVFEAAGGSSSISGGALNAAQLSFTSDDVMDFSGGVINLDGTTDQGISSAGGARYLNFTSDSLGSLFVDNLDSSGLNSLLSDGRVRFDGVTNQSLFSATVDGSGYNISVIPEPSTLLLVVLGLILPAVAFCRRRRG